MYREIDITNRAIYCLK